MTHLSDIAGLSERLRAWSPMIASGYECPAASTAMIEAATALDALQARVKELEAEIPQLLTEQRRKLCAEHDKDITELKRVRRVAKEAIEAAESRATRAEQERDEAYERAAKVADDMYCDIGYPILMRIAGRGIAAAIRRLAAGTERGGK